MNDRNWERLLLATLERCRDHLPGPDITESELKKMTGIKRSQAQLGIDIDEIMELAEGQGRRRMNTKKILEFLGWPEEEVVPAPRNWATGTKIKIVKYRNEIAELRAALWDVVDVASSVGPVEAGSASWHHAVHVLGERREGEKHGRER